MIEVNQCVICEAPIRSSYRGIVAPFLAQRIWNRDAFPVHYSQCDRCNFGFFNPRLEPIEESRLYSGYRDEEYVRTRNATEPWYTPKLNNSFDDPETIAARCLKLRNVFNKHLPFLEPARVLDFGGDRGELIHSLFPDARKYVYDISNVEVLPGITALTLDQCKAAHFDLIICSNVLEHVASPRLLLQQIASVAKRGAHIFLEVPVESPLDWRTSAKRVAQAAILLVTRPKLAFSLIQLRSLNVMHEHLNFFSLQSLEYLASLCPEHWETNSSGVYPAFSRTASMTAWILLEAI